MMLWGQDLEFGKSKGTQFSGIALTILKDMRNVEDRHEPDQGIEDAWRDAFTALRRLCEIVVEAHANPPCPCGSHRLRTARYRPHPRGYEAGNRTTFLEPMAA